MVKFTTIYFVEVVKMSYQDLLEARKSRGLEIAQANHITKNDKGWLVPSQSNSTSYLVQFSDNGDEPTCECPDHRYRGGIKCKHIFAVELTITREINEKGVVTETKTAKVTYSQDWTAYNLAQTQQKELFMKLLKDVTSNIPQPEYSSGRPKLPLSDMVFLSALEVFSTFSLRRFLADAGVAKERGYLVKVPSYMSVARCMESPDVTPVIKGLIEATSLALSTVETDFTIDSSGFGTSRFVKWYDYKYGKKVESRT